jgi:hypothetical protein
MRASLFDMGSRLRWAALPHPRPGPLIAHVESWLALRAGILKALRHLFSVNVHRNAGRNQLLAPYPLTK